MGSCVTEIVAEEMDAQELCLRIDGMTPEGGLYTDVQRPVNAKSNSSWRVSPEPWWLPPDLITHFESLGEHLYAFYRTANLLYSHSARGIQPPWVAAYLDQGKPDEVIAYGRMNRFKQRFPHVIRPDVIPTREGMIVAELDSVPGGIGFTASLGQRYGKLGYDIVGGADGMVSGFARMIRSVAGASDPVLAVVVSEESAGYRPEMTWLAEALVEAGLDAHVVGPEDVGFSESGLYLEGAETGKKIDVIYRFFELFDLRNIPKIDLILYAIRKGLVKTTPPPKAYLEEKMLMGLFHHPMLADFWRQHLGRESVEFLTPIFPKTWIIDPRPLAPHGIIPGLEPGGRSYSNWRTLGELGQKQRQFVIKPSGFSETAWGSRGVSVGHDMSQDDWKEAVEAALASFERTPHILQEYHTGSGFWVSYYDFETDQMERFRGRMRLCPYYFLIDDQPVLSGIQATICPDDKKVLHGMVDAVVVPCGDGSSRRK
ncbi:MAG: hypothetical protein QGI83_23275 [Candidatus Latescibacteria bacterium]|jgi:hypothetical protein|nr:hypothetical protein [Candidatus Latescibacterota bacterium]